MATDTGRDPESRERILAIANRLAEHKDGEDGDRETPAGWISFRLADKTFALPVTHVRGVHRAGHITPLPQSPSAVRGLTNLRGRVITVVDLALRLGLGKTEADGRSRILDAEHGGRRLGLLTERTESLLRVRPSDLEPNDDSLEPSVARFAAGAVAMRTGAVILLDPERILHDQARTDPGPRRS